MAYLSKRTGEEVDALLDKVEQGGGGASITVDTELSATSDNAIANSAVAKGLKGKQDTLTLITKPNGNIVIDNLAGQSKEFMPATPSGDPMHYAYEAVGAVWNANTGYWEFYDMKDITNVQMRRAYNFGHFSVKDAQPLAMANTASPSAIRFNLPRKGTPSGWYESFNSFASGNYKIEFINPTASNSIADWLDNTSQIVNGSYAFAWCESLRAIFGNIDLQYATNVSSMFQYCGKLENVYVKNLKQDISFADSPNLSYESLLYAIENCASKADFVIIVHPDIWDKIYVEGDWSELDMKIIEQYDEKETSISIVTI